MNGFIVVIGIIIIVIYTVPLLISKINAGGLFGISVGLLTMFAGVYFSEIVALSDKKTIQVIICIFLISASIFMLLFLLTLLKIIKRSKRTATSENVLIVLGCRVKGIKPSLALEKRCKSALNYLKSNPDCIAILSGGKGADEGIAECECMQNYLVEHGFTDKRIVLENKSTSTEENIAYSKEIIDKLNLSTDVVICTSDYHLMRALMIAKDYKLNATALPSKTMLLLKATYFTREVFGIWQIKIKSIIKKPR